MRCRSPVSIGNKLATAMVDYLPCFDSNCFIMLTSCAKRGEEAHFFHIVFHHGKHHENIAHACICLINMVCHRAAHAVVLPAIQDPYIFIKNNKRNNVDDYLQFGEQIFVLFLVGLS